jgi:hypothetical protein
MNNTTSRNLIILAVIAILAIGAWAVLTMPDRRTTGQRIGDAVDALPNGLDAASRNLESRTPGQKLGDAIKDAGQGVKDSTGQ